MPLRLLTAGESHGPELTAILEGLPAGLEVSAAGIDTMLARRQRGFGSGGRMQIERDAALITGGVQGGRTTGAPVAMRLRNLDHAAWSDRDIPPATVPRPGHADLAATEKYGYEDLRLASERASARETAARTAAGALCAQLLDALGVRVGSYVVSIGNVGASLADDYASRLDAAEASDVRCPDPAAAEAMHRAIAEAIRAEDTLGGVFEVVALGAPPGLGSHVHWDRRLTGRLLGAAGSIPAVKGAEVGPAFANSRLRGTAVHPRLAADGPRSEGGRVLREGDRSGGVEGGISSGDPIVLRCAMKPIATTLTPLDSVDLATGEPAATSYERSDFCAAPRAAVVGEAMVAFVLADEMLAKLGGDSMREIRPRLDALSRSELTAFRMAGAPWRFGYARDDGGTGPAEDAS